MPCWITSDWFAARLGVAASPPAHTIAVTTTLTASRTALPDREPVPNPKRCMRLLPMRASDAGLDSLRSSRSDTTPESSGGQAT